MTPKCNQCDSMTIQGVYCHERGCPNTNKVWNCDNEEWVTPEEDFDYMRDVVQWEEDAGNHDD